MYRCTSISAFLTVFLLGGCGEYPATPEPVENPLFSSANAASSSQATVFTFADETPVGTSRLIRNDRGVAVTLSTSGLEPGDAVTMWMVVFNVPSECSPEDDGGPPVCGEDDLAPDTPVMVDVINVTGSLVGGSGKATVAAHHKAGEVGYSVFDILGAPAPGLIDARTAELHFIVRTHGPMIPGLAYEMTSTFAAGCAGFPSVLGTPGPNTCEDLQFSVHK